MTRLVFISLESAADALLAAGMLPPLYSHFSPETLTVVCPSPLARFYRLAPFPCEIIEHDPQLIADPRHAAYILQHLARGAVPELCINARTHRDPFSDQIALGCHAREVVGHAYPHGTNHPLTPHEVPGYSRLVPDPGVKMLEVQRHRALLNMLGIPVERVNPAIWTAPDDAAWADTLLRENHFSTEKTLILFSEPCHPFATWTGFAQALVPLCLREGLSIVAVGDAADSQGTQQLQAMTAARVKVLDLRGRADIFQTAELMRRARAAVGLENIFAYVACAVGCPHVILLAGGEFGRMMPYSPLTAGVILAIHCLGCGWNCRFKSPYCATAVLPFMMQIALEETLRHQAAPELPRLFVQHPDFAMVGLAKEGLITPEDCFLNPDALPPALFEILLVVPSHVNPIAAPEFLYGCPLRRVTIQPQPGRSVP